MLRSWIRGLASGSLGNADSRSSPIGSHSRLSPSGPNRKRYELLQPGRIDDADHVPRKLGTLGDDPKLGVVLSDLGSRFIEPM